MKEFKFFHGYIEKRIFRIEVGNIDPNEAEEYVRRVAERFRRQPLVDNNGNFDLRYNQIHMNEDYFIPVRNNKN